MHNKFKEKDIPGSACIFLAPILESVISLRNPGLFLLENGIKNKDMYVLRAACCCGVIAALS